VFESSVRVIRELVALRHRQYSPREIAKFMGLTRAWLRQSLEKLKPEEYRRGLRDVALDDPGLHPRVFDDFMHGLGTRRIGEKYGISPVYVRHIVRDEAKAMQLPNPLPIALHTKRRGPSVVEDRAGVRWIKSKW
jgi:hypothetical protein